jgi:hypothetical protein
MPRAAEGRKIGFELRDFRTHDELAMREHLRDRIVDAFAETAALRGDVDERNRSLRRACAGSSNSFPGGF